VRSDARMSAGDRFSRWEVPSAQIVLPADEFDGIEPFLSAPAPTPPADGIRDVLPLQHLLITHRCRFDRVRIRSRLLNDDSKFFVSSSGSSRKNRFPR